jgi:hypothetical protein
MPAKTHGHHHGGHQNQGDDPSQRRNERPVDAASSVEVFDQLGNAKRPKVFHLAHSTQEAVIHPESQHQIVLTPSLSTSEHRAILTRSGSWPKKKVAASSLGNENHLGALYSVRVRFANVFIKKI